MNSITGTTVTDGTTTLSGGSITNATYITANTVTDGTTILSGGSIILSSNSNYSLSTIPNTTQLAGKHGSGGINFLTSTTNGSYTINGVSYPSTMWLDGNGKLGIGITDPSSYLHVYGTNGSNGTGKFTGSLTALSFTATSDYRVKDDVRDLDNTLFNVNNLRPVLYYNTLLKQDDVGFIAHEVQEHYPFMVTGEKDGTQNQSLNYNSFIGILVKEVKDLKQDVKDLKQQVKDLTQEVGMLNLNK